MAYILCLETATPVCSVALFRDSHLVSLRELTEGNTHAAQITVLIAEVMNEAAIEMSQLDAVAVSKGPGSYTGLRVGVSAAKGLCFALDIPLIGVETLKSMTRGYINKHPIAVGELFVPMLDARRMEVYCSVFDDSLHTVRETEAKVIDEKSFNDVTDNKQIHFFGNGADKCKSTLSALNAVFDNEFRCSSVYMGELAWELYSKRSFEDLAYFEPYYLKDFVGTFPKRMV